MCTLTYIPLSDNNCFITQNRDEFIGRAMPGLVKKSIAKKTVLFPQDKGGKGTWIATSDNRQIVCLLNGAFVKHKHRPPYRKSRGLVVLDYFASPDPKDFFESYDLDEIEPFTMVVYDNGKLYEWRWDEKERHLAIKDPKEKHIWASCTLYPPEHQFKRIEWFQAWQDSKINIDQAGVLDFHMNAGDGDPEYDLVMNRMDIVKTTSITSIQVKEKSLEMKHIDLLRNEEQCSILDLSHSVSS